MCRKFHTSSSPVKGETINANLDLANPNPSVGRRQLVLWILRSSWSSKARAPGKQVWRIWSKVPDVPPATMVLTRANERETSRRKKWGATVRRRISPDRSSNP